MTNTKNFIMTSLLNPKQRKRTYSTDTDNDPDSDTEKRSVAAAAGVEGAWPRFLVVEGTSTERPLSGLNPFVVEKCFQGVSTNGFENIKKLRNGSYLVDCKTPKASKLLLKNDGRSWCDRPIKVSVHKGLNTSKGVLRCADLQGCPEQEIQKELESQGVLEVKRVHVTKDGQRVPTNTLFLTFAMASLPESVKVGYIKAKVSPFVPSPLRCFRCQKFGHTSTNCSAKEVCRECGKDKHEGECSESPKCVNCEGEHSSTSKNCPKWKLEVEIQRIKTLDKCSFTEARKRASAYVPINQSYAKTVATPAVAERGTGSEKAIEKLSNAITVLVERVDKLEQLMSSFLAKQGTTTMPPPSGASTPSPPQTQPGPSPRAPSKPTPSGSTKPSPHGTHKTSRPGTKKPSPPGTNKAPAAEAGRGRLTKSSTRSVSTSNLVDLQGVNVIKGLDKKDIQVSPSKAALPVSNRFSSLEDGMETDGHQ